MAAVASELLETETCKKYEQSVVKTTRRRHAHKGRIIKQGYNRSEREDTRREAARLFLSGITLDSHLGQRTETPTQRVLSAAATTTPTRDERLAGSPLADTVLSSAVKRDLQFEHQPVGPAVLALLQSANASGDHSRLYQRNFSRFDSPRTSQRKRLAHTKKQSLGSVDTSHIPPRSAWALHNYAADPENKRREILTLRKCSFSFYTELPSPV